MEAKDLCFGEAQRFLLLQEIGKDKEILPQRGQAMQCPSDENQHGQQAQNREGEPTQGCDNEKRCQQRRKVKQLLKRRGPKRPQNPMKKNQQYPPIKIRNTERVVGQAPNPIGSKTSKNRRGQGIQRVVITTKNAKAPQKCRQKEPTHQRVVGLWRSFVHWFYSGGAFGPSRGPHC